MSTGGARPHPVRCSRRPVSVDIVQVSRKSEGSRRVVCMRTTGQWRHAPSGIGRLSEALPAVGAEAGARFERGAALGAEARPCLGRAPSHALLWCLRRPFLRRPRRGRGLRPPGRRPGSLGWCLLHGKNSLASQAAGLGSYVGRTALGAHNLFHLGRHAITRLLAGLPTGLPTTAKDLEELLKTEDSPECLEESETPVAINEPVLCRTGCRSGSLKGWLPHSSGTSLQYRRPPPASGRSPG
jgi:hypothetical protein